MPVARPAAPCGTHGTTRLSPRQSATLTPNAVSILLTLCTPPQPHPRPGGIRQQFKAAQPMVESILRAVKQAEGLQGPLAANIWDQGDAVGAWTGKNLACVLFPTAATLDRVGVK